MKQTLLLAATGLASVTGTDVNLIDDPTGSAAAGQKTDYAMSAEYSTADSTFSIKTILKVPLPTTTTNQVYSSYLQWKDQTASSGLNTYYDVATCDLTFTSLSTLNAIATPVS